MSNWIALGWLSAVLVLMLVVYRHQRGVSPGMYRTYYMVAGIGAWLIYLLPNPWLQAVCAAMLLNALMDRNIGTHLPRIMPWLLTLAAGVTVMPFLTAASVVPILSAIVISGGVLACYAAWDLGQEWNQREHIKLYACQENVNNTQSISVICTSAGLGLMWAESAWWGLSTLAAAFPILWTTWNDWRCERSVTMGPVLLLGVFGMMLPLVIGWWAAWLVPFVALFLAWATGEALRREKWWDSGRIRTWFTSLMIGWWQGGWTVRLLGRGWQSWVGFQDFLVDIARKTNRHAIVNTKFMMSTAHNEFVQFLFEHGAIGLLLLVGYCATALWQLGAGNAQAQAVYIAACGVLGVACTLHPWTWTHGTLSECDEHGNPIKGGAGVKLYTIGSPALNWLSLMVALLVEVIR